MAKRKKSLGCEQDKHIKKYVKNPFGITEGKGSKPWTEQDKAGRSYRKLSPGAAESVKHLKGK